MGSDLAVGGFTRGQIGAQATAASTRACLARGDRAAILDDHRQGRPHRAR